MARKHDEQYTFGEIAKAQARHGYYDDALKTLRLIGNLHDDTLEDLVRIRAQSGDIAAAEKMAKQALTRGGQLDAEQDIALVQADEGHFRGARATMKLLPRRLQQTVLGSIGVAQVDKGDIEASLKTASEMEVGRSDELLYDIAAELREHGESQRALQVAKRIVDPDMKQAAESADSNAPAEGTTDACQLALQMANHGRFADAYTEIEGKKCRCDFVALIHAKARDVAGAEHAMRTCTDSNPSDISSWMADVAQAFAAEGEIGAALKFAEAARVPGAYQGGEGYIAPVVRDIARAWVAREGAGSALKWARSRPAGYERAMALLGAAESIHNSARGLAKTTGEIRSPGSSTAK